MKTLAAWMLSVAALAGCHVPQDQNVPNREQLLRDGITQRHYYLYVSSRYDPRTPAPVIISLQGTAPYDTADGQVKEWKKIAEDAGAVLICPTLRSSDGLLTGSTGGLIERLLEDERFVMTVLGQLHYRFNIDRRNVFLTSWSGGGYPLYFIGLRNPDVFSAIVARQSTFRAAAVEGWFPDTARHLPVLIFHGTFDFVPVQAQSKEAYRFLTERGFTNVHLTTTPGGHVRHPEVAMEFFRRHWNHGPVAGPPGARRNGSRD